MTDVESFEWLEPKADGFRNYLEGGYPIPPAEALMERASSACLCRDRTIGVTATS